MTNFAMILPAMPPRPPDPGGLEERGGPAGVEASPKMAAWLQKQLLQVQMAVKNEVEAAEEKRMQELSRLHDSLRDRHDAILREVAAWSALGEVVAGAPSGAEGEPKRVVSDREGSERSTGRGAQAPSDVGGRARARRSECSGGSRSGSIGKSADRKGPGDADQTGECGVRSEMVESLDVGRALTGIRQSLALRSNSSVAPEGGGNKAVPQCGLACFVKSTTFDVFFILCIVLSSVTICVDGQYDGWAMGSELNVDGYEEWSESSWAGTKQFLKVCETLFGVLFTVELVLKLAVYKLPFFRDKWNIFDIVIVLSWLLEQLLGQDQMMIDPLVLRAVRVFRLSRLLKLMHHIRAMDALYIMVKTLQGAGHAVAHTCVVLGLLHLFLGLFVSQALYIFYFRNDGYPTEDKVAIFEYFGSFSRSTLTVFEMTLGDWASVTRLLAFNVTQWLLIPCLIFKITVGFAALAIIDGVFIQETFKVASTDDTIIKRQIAFANMVQQKKMENLFEVMDRSGDGDLSLSEIESALNSRALREDIEAWLESVNLRVDDLPCIFFTADNDGNHRLSAKEFVECAQKLKDAARGMDLWKMRLEMKGMEEVLQRSIKEAMQPSDSVDLS